MDTERMISPTDLAQLLQIPVQTIYRWRYRGEGPRAYRIGRHVRYRMSDIEAWLDRQADGRLER